jgi:hypothetical protein
VPGPVVGDQRVLVGLFQQAQADVLTSEERGVQSADRQRRFFQWAFALAAVPHRAKAERMSPNPATANSAATTKKANPVEINEIGSIILVLDRDAGMPPCLLHALRVRPQFRTFSKLNWPSGNA